MVVLTVDERDLDRLAGKGLCRRQAAKAAADNYYFSNLVHLSGLFDPLASHKSGIQRSGGPNIIGSLYDRTAVAENRHLIIADSKS